MADPVGSDHPSVPTCRGRLVRRGGTRRPAVEVTEEEAGRPREAVVRLVIDGRETYAPAVDRDGGWLLAGAYDNPRLARERSGADRLAEWAAAHDVEFGRAVLVDVVEAGEVYGLRRPGERAVYDVARGRDPSLRRIAEDLDR